jgi:hypothetical protein
MVNFCYMAEPLSSEPLELDDVDRIGLERGRKFASVGNTYMKEHSYNGDPLQTSRVRRPPALCDCGATHGLDPSCPDSEQRRMCICGQNVNDS